MHEILKTNSNMLHSVSLNNLTICGSQVNSLLDCNSVQHMEKSLLPQALPWQTSHLRVLSLGLCQ